MKELFNKISKQLESREANRPYFSDNNYSPVDINKDNFKDIPDNKPGEIAFIDGGNIEIIGNNNFSFQLMRIYYTIYDDNQRKESRKNDYFVLITSVKKEENIIYQVEVYKDDELIGKEESKLTKNNEQLKPENIINNIRRTYEIRAIEEISKSLKSNSIIVIDGNLCAKDDNEQKELDKAYEKVKEKQLLLAAVSKTSSNLTDTGVNLVGYINNLGDENKKWIYTPICVNNNPLHKAEIIIARLHEKSEYAFIIDIFKENKDKIQEICSQLASISKDPVFLGYPYGLIEADRGARCQKQEQSYLQTRLLQIENNKKVRNLINTNKAHDILDSIN